MAPCVTHLGTMVPELPDLPSVVTCHVHCHKLTLLQAYSELIPGTVSGSQWQVHIFQSSHFGSKFQIVSLATSWKWQTHAIDFQENACQYPR